MADPDIEIYDEDGEELYLPSKRELCYTCNGEGKVGYPAFANGITASERARDWDDEDFESYLNGAYDIECPDCKGRKWVLVPNLDRCTKAEREAWEAHCQEQSDYDAMVESERRFGC